MLAPGKTPKPLLTTLNQAMAEVSKDPELLEKIRAQGIEPREIGLDRFDAHIRAEMVRLDPVFKSILRPEVTIAPGMAPCRFVIGPAPVVLHWGQLSFEEIPHAPSQELSSRTASFRP